MGLVYKVLNGNFLLIKIKQEIIEVCLEGVISPRLATRSRDDEPFAWSSREFLRRILIGKKVKIFFTKRSVGSIPLVKIKYSGRDVGYEVIKSGWGKPTRVLNEEYGEELQLASELARQNHSGIYTTDRLKISSSIRTLPKSTATLPFEELIEISKFKGIVEEVKTGSKLKVILLPKFYLIQVKIVGINTPGFKKIEYELKPGIEDTRYESLPFSEEAKEYSEKRLLGRTIELQLLGKEHSTNTFIASIRCGGKNIAEFLLIEGLAKIDEWSIMKEPNEKKLRKAELEGKRKRKRLFSIDKEGEGEGEDLNGVGEGLSKEVETSFEGKCIAVISVDTFLIKKNKSSSPEVESEVEVEGVSEQIKVRLAHVNVPKFSRSNPIKYAFEAREFVRKMVIGKQLSLQVLAKGQISLVDIIIQQTKKNLAEELLKAGYAHIGRSNINKPSIFYKDYLKAGTFAEENNKGMYNVSHPSPITYNDVSREGFGHLSELYAFIKKETISKGIIEYIISSTKMVVLLPTDAFIVTVGLAGVQSLQRDDPLADIARDTLIELVMSRDVKIDFQDVSRGSYFHAYLFVSSPKFKTNLSVEMVKKGLLKIHERSCQRSKYKNSLIKAQAFAKKNKLGLWKNYENSTLILKKQFKGKIINIEHSGLFYVIDIEDNNYLKLIKWQEKTIKLNKLNISKIKKNFIFSIFFKEKFQRCKCLSFNKRGRRKRKAGEEAEEGGIINFEFLDFGGKSKIKIDEIFEIDELHIANLPPLAKPSKLYAIWTPELGSEYSEISTKKIY